MTKITDGFNFDIINRYFTNTRNLQAISNGAWDNRVKERFDSLPINTSDAVTVGLIMQRFNDLYLAFINDLNKLERFNIAKEIDFEYFTNKNNNRYAQFHLDNQSFNSDYSGSMKLYITDENNNIDAYTMPLNSGFGVKIPFNMYDSTLLREYLDLFDKHSELIQMYMILTGRKYQLYKDLCSVPHTSLSLSVDQYWDIYNGLRNIYLYLVYNDNFAKISYNLGENFGIDVQSSYVRINKEKLEFDDVKYFEELTNNVLLNKSFVRERGLYPKKTLTNS